MRLKSLSQSPITNLAKATLITFVVRPWICIYRTRQRVIQQFHGFGRVRGHGEQILGNSNSVRAMARRPRQRRG